MFNHFPQHGHRKTRKDLSRSFQIPVAHQHQVFFQKSLHLWGQLRVRGKHLSILPEEPRMAGLAAPATALHPGAIRQEGLGVGSGGWRMMDVSEPNFQLRQHQPQEACFTSLSSLRFSLRSIIYDLSHHDSNTLISPLGYCCRRKSYIQVF